MQLAGQRLEKDKSKSTELESMMRALTELVTRGQVDTQVGNMVHSVHELRNDNWGREPSYADSSRTNATLSHQVQQVPQVPNEPGASNYTVNTSKTNSVVPQLSDDGLVYGPDGQMILSEEESKFLHDSIAVEQKYVRNLGYPYFRLTIVFKFLLHYYTLLLGCFI